MLCLWVRGSAADGGPGEPEGSFVSGQKAASGRSWGGLGVGASERCHGAGGAEWGLAMERGLGSTRQRQSGVVGRLVWPGAKREPSRRASGLSPLRPCGWARPEASAVCAVGQAVPSLRHPSSHRGAQQLLCLVRAQIHLPPPPSHPLPVTNTPSLALTEEEGSFPPTGAQPKS